MRLVLHFQHKSKIILFIYVLHTWCTCFCICTWFPYLVTSADIHHTYSHPHAYNHTKWILQENLLAIFHINRWIWIQPKHVLARFAVNAIINHLNPYDNTKNKHTLTISCHITMWKTPKPTNMLDNHQIHKFSKIIQQKLVLVGGQMHVGWLTMVVYFHSIHTV